MATTIERLSAKGKTVTGVLSNKPRKGRYRILTILRGSLKARAGQTKEISIRLNATGRMLRAEFKRVLASVKITETRARRSPTTIRTTKVTFGPDPPKTRLAASPFARRFSVSFSARCRGRRGQICRGTGEITAYKQLAANGHTVTRVSRTPSGHSNS